MIPMDSRPLPTARDRLRVLTFNSTFLAYLIFAHTFQLLFLPFLVLSVLLSFTTSEPFKSIKHTSREVFRLGIKWTKEIFASILIALVRLFGRTKFVITADSREELEKLVRRDGDGRVIGFKLDKHAIWMSNHQVSALRASNSRRKLNTMRNQCYIDWILIWIVMAYGRVSEGIVIIIKASLQWAPIVGPVSLARTVSASALDEPLTRLVVHQAMQLFRFVFLSRAKPLSKSTMYETARDSVERDDPFQLVIFPEGTLYSRLTRPKSKAFADAQGIVSFDVPHLFSNSHELTWNSIVRGSLTWSTRYCLVRRASCILSDSSRPSFPPRRRILRRHLSRCTTSRWATPAYNLRPTPSRITLSSPGSVEASRLRPSTFTCKLGT